MSDENPYIIPIIDGPKIKRTPKDILRIKIENFRIKRMDQCWACKHLSAYCSKDFKYCKQCFLKKKATPKEWPRELKKD